MNAKSIKFKQSAHHRNIFSLFEKKKKGCWLWRGYVDPHYGYGRYGGRQNRWQAHRLIYTLLTGSIPSDKTLDHLCRRRNCVNPAHLEVVDMRTNILRGNGLAAINAKKTHCPKGHSLERNNIVKKVRGRNCLLCKNDRNRLWMKRYRKNQAFPCNSKPKPTEASKS